MTTEIFKICYLKNNKIDKIHIYNGNTTYNAENVAELYKTDNTIFDGIFNDIEIKNIEENNIPVFFQPLYIYIDDTIEIIKKKMIQSENIAFEEIYLFCSILKCLLSERVRYIEISFV